MRRNQLDVKRSRLWVARLKGSLSVEHLITGDELRAIKRYFASREDNLPWLFVSERQAQLTRQAVNYIVAREKAKLGRVWPHMLRHSCGYYLADQYRSAYDAGFTLATAIPSTPPITPGLPGIGSKGCGSSLRPKPAVTPPPEPDAQPTCARLGGIGPRTVHCHPSVAHNQILNGASVISSPFIGVELTSWKARTLPQVTAFFDPFRSSTKCSRRLSEGAVGARTRPTP
jgi:hypothetical protein